MLSESINQSHLKSAQEVIDYSIKATDGDIGHVSDFIVDDVQGPFAILSSTVEPGGLARKFWLPPQWIAHVDWRNSNVYLNLSQNEIKTGPEFHPSDFKHNYDQGALRALRPKPTSSGKNRLTLTTGKEQPEPALVSL